MNGQYILIDACIAIIQRYILDLKGVLVNIQPPNTPQREELFIKALDKACIYYNIQL